jgi:hypothetical protein
MRPPNEAAQKSDVAARCGCRVIIVMDAELLGQAEHMGQPVEWGKAQQQQQAGMAAQNPGGPLNGNPAGG